MSYQILKSFVSTYRSFLNLNRKIYTHRILYGSHYDTLKLPRNCSTKEVRDSFIKLSKKCHPDKNRNDPSTHAQFVKLNEAYSVLSRPDRRRAYDLTLTPISTHRHRGPHGSSPFDVYTTAYGQRVVWRDESFWEYKDKTSGNSNSSSSDYYGIRGIKRVPNGWIAILCIAFAAVGVWLQVLVIKHSSTFNRKALDERSQESSRILSEVRQRALRHGNEVQIELLKQESERSKSSMKAPTSVSPSKSPNDNKSNTARHPKSQHREPHDVYESKMQGPPDNTKPYLGYLGDMPHRVERDTLKPMLCNTQNVIDKKSVNEPNFPKPVANGTEMTARCLPTGQDTVNPVSGFSQNSHMHENEDSVSQFVLYSTLNSIENGNEQFSKYPKLLLI